MGIAVQIAEISEQDLVGLVNDAVQESRTIEYKSQLYGNDRAQKIELLADVSAFANSLGGDLLIGIDETNGVASNVGGVQCANVDAELLRLESILRTGLEPRLLGHELLPIPLANGDCVIVIRIRGSRLAPHRVVLEGHSKFYTRTSAGKHPMDVTELREAFLHSQGIEQRIREFRNRRALEIEIGEGPVPMGDGPKAILHLIPEDSFSTSINLEVGVLRNQRERMLPLGSGIVASHATLDGYISYDRVVDMAGEPASAFCLFFRTGQVESVGSGSFSVYEGTPYLAGPSIAEDILHRLPMYLAALRQLEIAPPLYVALTLVGIKNYPLAIAGGYSPATWARDEMFLPEVIVESYDTPVDIALRPLFDSMWNAWGCPGCPNYTAEGRYQA
jgi:hypothetical protein